MAKKQIEIRDRVDYEERIRELAALIRERAVPWADDSAEKQIRRKARARQDVLYFAETYFPHYVTEGWAEFHREEMEKLSRALEGDVGRIQAEIWSRGFGKTTLCGIILPIWATEIKRLNRYCIHVGADKDLAKERTAAIKLELQLNARLRHDWPELGMEEGAGEDHDFKTPGNGRFRAQGYRQAIRGKMHGPHRPRLIIVDDLESHLDGNPEIADKKLKFVLEEAYGAFGKQGGLLVWLGNLTTKESALSRFVEKCDGEPESEYFGYRIVKAEEDGKESWAAAYPRQKLEAIQAVMGKSGYERHYLMRPVRDGGVFKEEWMRWWNPWAESGIRGAADAACGKSEFATPRGAGLGLPRMPGWEELKRAQTITYCDPSLGGGESNDYKAVVSVAFWGGMYWIVDIWIRKATILEMLHYMYEVERRWRSRVYMEQNFWQRIIWEYLPQVAAEEGYMLGISGVENRIRKEERILKLQPLFEWGHIWSCVISRDWELMKDQLTGFPGAGYDDGPDALAGAIERFGQIASQNRYETIERGNGGYMGMF